MVRSLKPYVPGEQTRNRSVVKLNTNENPYPPSPRVIDAIKQAADADLRLYPDLQALQLREAIAQALSVSVENIFIGNGSDEVLALSFMAFFKNSRTLQFPDISYSFYPVYCNLLNIEYQCVPLSADMTIPIDQFSDSGGVVLANPNAPTSLALSRQSIESLLGMTTRSVVLVDEAYVDFGAQSAVPLITQYPNLLVTQTFSKSRALAGMRIGFAVGDSGLIAALERVKDSFNSYPLDTLAQAAATAAMRDTEYFERRLAAVIKTRTTTSERLRELGFEVLDSKANFLFAKHPRKPGVELFRQLRESGFLTRHWQSPRIEQYLRISIGTDQQMRAFIRALEKIVS